MQNLLQTPFSFIKTIHFTGIGGIGMSGIAELFHKLNYHIQGSDLKENGNVIHLRKLGIDIKISQDSKNIKNADILVISSAVKEDNPEYIEALRLGIPVYKRSQMLAEIMRFKWSVAVAGTHGKTTTTSLVSHILSANHLDPTAIIGGIVNSWGNNSRFGKSNWLVAESDESDGSFVDLPATMSIVTNIEAEHMDYYKTYAKLQEYFIRFINNIPFFGFSILCVDNEGVRDILPFVKQRKIIKYGSSSQADYRVTNIRNIEGGSMFDVTYNYQHKPKTVKDITLPMYGYHNILNALAAITFAHNIGVTFEVIKDALEHFKGIGRRFTNVGVFKNITFIDDYAHHPSEIEAVITAANDIMGEGKILSVVQPHKYSRLEAHFDQFCRCFNKSDYLIVLDVFPAGEKEIKGVNSKALVQGIKDYGHKHVLYLQDVKQLTQTILDINAKDKLKLAIFMGAGSITNIVRETYTDLKNHE
ncbi:UDP-N-acetylmuramate--L-alanine ligase [Candidatus Hepatincola sp. Pdp]